MYHFEHTNHEKLFLRVRNLNDNDNVTMECIELNSLRKHMKKARSTQTVILVLN